MRVGHVVQSFSQLSETFIYDSVRSLGQTGIEQRIFTAERVNRDERPFEPVSVLEPAAGPAAKLPALLERALTPRGERFSRSWIGLRAGLRRELSAHPVDLLHAHFGPQAVFALPAIGQLPLVVSFYGHDISRLVLQPRWRRAYHRLWPRVSAVFVLSEDMAELARAAHAPVDRIQVVHLGRRLRDFQWQPPTETVRRLVSVGRLVEKKGHDDLIDALTREGLEHVELDIVGDGPLREALERRIEAQSLRDRVRLVGARSNRETLRLLRNAHAFALTSKTASDGDKEGTPTVLIEAQALGLPCISTRHAGIPEMIPRENHRYLAEEGDVIEIAETIRHLCGRSVSELVGVFERGRAHVERGFDTDRIAERAAWLYSKAVKGE